MKSSISLVLIFAWSLIHAQSGFLGKKITLNVGTSFSPPLLNSFYGGQTENQFVEFYQWSLLPPEFKTELGIVAGRSFELMSSFSIKGLQNTGFYSHQSSYSISDESVTVYIDSFMFRTNTYNLSLGMRKFTEFAPIGKYVDFGVTFCRAQSIVYPTYFTRVEYEAESYKVETTTKSKTGVLNTNAFGLNFGFGRTRLLTRWLDVDYGFRSTFFLYYLLGNSNYHTTDFGKSFNYKNSFNEVTDFIINRNLQSSYAFEMYIRFGLAL